ncbi:MAG: oligosaccharide flippase family protein [Sphingomonas paucimobilis]
MAGFAGKLMRGGLPNMAIRGSQLFFRFALSFYIVSQLGLEAAGIYGLAIGAIGIVPATVGWGLNYFISREVVGHTPATAAGLIRDRLTITLVSLLVGTVVAVPVLVWMTGGLSETTILILILLWLETLALDIYMPMIGLEMALFANVMVFIRSALWIPIVVGIGFLYPPLQTLNAIFIGWIASHFVALGMLVVHLRRWPVGEGLRAGMQLGRLGKRVRDAWYIYFSDLGIVGLGYADRFILNALLGLTATGIYSFYFSITNALQTLIATAVVQLALPRMVRAARGGDPSAWRGEIRQQMVKTLAYAGVLSIAIFGVTELIFYVSPEGRFPVYRTLLAIMLLAAVIRSGSDLLNIAITSTGRDHVYAVTNIVGVVLTLIFGAGFMWAFGLIGAGLSAAATATSLFVIRAFYLRSIAHAPTLPAAVAS